LRRLLLEKVRGDERVLLYGQLRMWALDRIEEGDASYNMPAAFRLSGNLNVVALGEAFRDVILRHEPLHTVIVENRGEPQGKLIPVVEGEALLKVEDLSYYDMLAHEDEISRKISEESCRVFDLSHDLMLRATLWIRAQPRISSL